ncbi:MAG: Na/Pi cotransporter family protein [Planctomycetes bacterium]|nr:Na/Pi cotransporter family protein [Planctomycetota bacterium]
MKAEDWFTLAYTVVGGLGIFLFGMKLLSESLQALASDFIRKLIGWLTNNRAVAMGVGVLLTVIVQSSSVTTVMLVGFINAGLMTLTQAVGVILGANIGTTITGWIIAFKVGKYGLLLVGAGFVPFFFMKSIRWKSIGKVLIALGMVFLGLQFMSGGFKPLSKTNDFQSMLVWFQADSMLSVLACVALGCLLTFIVQSSSAMLAITMSLAAAGQIDYQTAAALVLGENIGTTITMHLAAIGGTIDAKRASYAHIMFNVIGVSVMVIIFPWYTEFVESTVNGAPGIVSGLFKTSGETAVEGVDTLIMMKIAAGHSLFNITNNLFFLPLLPLLVKLVVWMKPDKGMKSKKRLKLSGDLTKISPELALEEAEGEIRLMRDVVMDSYRDAAKYVRLTADQPDLYQNIDHLEHVTDNIQMEVTLFLTEVMQLSMTADQARRGYSLIRISDELESIVDYCQNLAKYRARMFRDKMVFTSDAQSDLNELLERTGVFLEGAVQFMIVHHDAEMNDEEVRELIRQSDGIGERADEIRDAHLERVREGRCDALAGMVFSDIVVALRRIKNHTVNLIDARIGRWEERRDALRNLERKETKRIAAAPAAGTN